MVLVKLRLKPLLHII